MCASTRFSSATASICSVKCQSRTLPTLRWVLKLKCRHWMVGSSLKIPVEGTQSGKQFRLRGKGVAPVRGGGAGDLMCRVVIETPVKLSRRQRELMEEFRTTLER